MYGYKIGTRKFGIELALPEIMEELKMNFINELGEEQGLRRFRREELMFRRAVREQQQEDAADIRNYHIFEHNGKYYETDIVAPPPEYLAFSYKVPAAIFLGDITWDKVYYPFSFMGKPMEANTIDAIFKNFYII